MSLKGRFISPPIRLTLGPAGLNFERADIEVYGLDQSGPSYEGRIFLNNPGANVQTPPMPENGYAGSFHVYGYGIWPEDIGKDRETRSLEPDGIRAPITKDVIATEAVRTAAAKSRDITVTVVPVYPGIPPRDANEALKLEGVRIVIHEDNVFLA
jgi:hypothetical protein